MNNNNVLGQHTAVLHQNHQFCGFPLCLSMKLPNYIQDSLFWSPHKLIQQLPPTLLKPIHQNSCAIFSLQRSCTKQPHSGYSVHRDMDKMCILTSESGTQNSPCSHQDSLNWPFLT